MLWKSTVIATLALALVAGCATVEPLTGTVQTVQKRAHLYDFEFVDQDNQSRRFSAMSYGVISVLAIIDGAEGDTTGYAKELDALAEKYAYDSVKVTMVCHSMPNPPMAKTCVLVGPYKPKRLNMICDATNEIKEAYEVTEKAEYVVIDYRGDVKGRTTDKDALDALIANAVEARRKAAYMWADALD